MSLHRLLLSGLIRLLLGTPLGRLIRNLPGKLYFKVQNRAVVANRL